MTMADTIAVMHDGVIEQMGAPEELYDQPATTFVSNFLGQSNLVRAEVVGPSGDEVVVDVHGSKVAAPASRSRRTTGTVWVGVRPEKVFLVPEDAARADGSNHLPGGTVVDVSFTGVSTQYVVRMPWGQELAVFEQNSGAGGRSRRGETVSLTWDAAHTFLLDADQDAHAGDESYAELVGADPGGARA